MISLDFRRQAVNRMCEELQIRMQLQEPPIAIAAPPSTEPEYPSAAVLIDSTKFMFTTDEEIQADGNNQPLVGSIAVLESTPNVDIGNGAYLSRVGVMVCKGRIWVGARLAPKREKLESLAMRAFFDDTMNPGVWVITLPNPTVGDYVLPFSWTATAHLGDSTWTGEYVFSERLWSWLTFELELDILVPRDNPAEAIVKQFIYGFDVHVDQPVDQDGNVVDLDGGDDNEYFDGYPPRRVDINGDPL